MKNNCRDSTISIDEDRDPRELNLTRKEFKDSAGFDYTLPRYPKQSTEYKNVKKMRNMTPIVKKRLVRTIRKGSVKP